MSTLSYTDPAWHIRERLEFNQGSDLTNIVKHLFAAMASGQKIEAIKAYRALTGQGLKESKDAVEAAQGPAKPNPICRDDSEYEYGHFVMTRSPNNGLNEFHYAWRCNESDCTLGYARVRANDAVENVDDGEKVYIMKVVAQSVTTTTMKDM